MVDFTADGIAVPANLEQQIAEALALLTPEERARYDKLVAEVSDIAAGKKREPYSYRAFVDYVSGRRYQWYRYAEVLADVLQRVADDLLLRVMVFAPPRHGKSEAVSRLFPAYYLYRHPTRWVGLSSYGAQLANSLARNARANYQQGSGAINVSGSINQWETGRGGGMWSAGIGGALTGRGMHLGIIDDPVKNAEEAASLKKRSRDRDWYQSTWYTRSEPQAAIVLMLTRWDPEDLAGWLLEQEWENQDDPDSLERWHIVHFEAIKESAEEIAERERLDERSTYPPSCTVEPDWRAPGEALNPDRYPREQLLRIKKRIGSYFWNALYQQRPRAREGSKFSIASLQLVEDFPRGGGTRLVRWWDKAATEDGGDFTAGVLVARDIHGIFYIVDVVHGQWADLKRDQIIRATTEADFQMYGTAVRFWSEQEPGSAGVDQARYFRRLLEGFTVYTERTTGNKDSYVDPLASTAQAGNLRMVRAPWNPVVRREFLDYPGKYDDIVEAAARAANKLARKGGDTKLPPSVSQTSYA